MAFLLNERQFDTGTVTINYAEGPETGRPLIALHGATSHWQELLPILSKLGEKWHIFAPDHRGHGKTGRAAGKYQLDDYVQDTIVFLKQCVGEPAIILGHSMGGLIALEVAAQVPSMVRALVLEDPALVAYTQQPEEIFVHPYFKGVYETLKNGRTMEVIVDWLRTINPPDTPDVVLQASARMLYFLDQDVLVPILNNELVDENSLPGVLQQVTCPVLVLQADPTLGATTEDRHVEVLKAHLPNGRIVQMKGAGHVIHISHTDAFLAHVIAFLEEIETT